MSASRVSNHVCKYKILIENCNINTPANGGEEVNTEMWYRRAKSFLVACQQTISTKACGNMWAHRLEMFGRGLRHQWRAANIALVEWDVGAGTPCRAAGLCSGTLLSCSSPEHRRSQLEYEASPQLMPGFLVTKLWCLFLVDPWEGVVC